MVRHRHQPNLTPKSSHSFGLLADVPIPHTPWNAHYCAVFEGRLPAPGRHFTPPTRRNDPAPVSLQGATDPARNEEPRCGWRATQTDGRTHLADIRRLDRELKANKKLITTAVSRANSTVTDIYGVGPIVAAFVIGYSGDIGRFASADHYAAYNGTAPIEYSSGGKTKHRLSLRGNRVLNHAIHAAAITQIRFETPGRRYYDKKIAEGKPARKHSAR